MKKNIMMFLTLLLSTLGAVAQNTITIGNSEMEYLLLGESVSVPVAMENVDDIVAVEIIVKLPEGASINADGCQLVASRANGHQISASCIDGNKNLYKVTAFSASNKPFKGNSGELMNLDIVTSAGWLDGRTYAVTITKALLCKSNGDNVCTDFMSGGIFVPNTPHADIKFDVTGIVATAKKQSDDQSGFTPSTFSLNITNTGTSTTGAITMQLPDWMSLQGAIMPIEPGQTATAVIAMAPKGEANTRFDGYISVNIVNGNNQILPYNVTIVSDAKGTVVFSVCDEYTYYDEEAPKVKNATIEVRNSSTGEVVATLNTGTTGTATITQPEGYYEYTVTAEGHETYTNSILIYPGQTTERTVNLSLGDGINIEYQVVETEEGDGYEIVTEATLEVAVPAPQVTISAPGRVKVSDVKVGEYVDIQVTLTNRGLIKARDVKLSVPEIDGFSWKALTPIFFDLRPQETSFITIRYTRETEADEGCSIKWEATYTWKCGDEPKSRVCRAFTSIGTNCKPCLPANCAVATIMEDEDVIVTVKLQFNQLLTLTRQAFEGTLTIENGSDQAMDDIVLQLTETMPNGDLATDREFDISYTEFTGFTGAASGPWTLEAGKTGVLKVKFIPTKFAAPIAAIDYVFGGNLTFSVDGKERHADLAEQLMTVKPTPELNLDYFMQRDVIADDAITKDVVELAEEAEFAVLISNVGYGDAENLKMVTAQPEMVDNEESLFLQYSITSSQLNGQEKSLAFGKSVTTDFGTLPAHSHAYAQWWMTSSLLGHFIEYDISYTQLTLSKNPNLSLINDVRIHELIRSVVVEGNANTNYGWAVNGEEDSQNLPDILYLSDGTTEPISVGQASTQENNENLYTLTVEAGTKGWTYAKVVDPTDGNATITEVTREDGTVVPLRNIWQTWATVVDKKRATHENLIHIIDNCKSGATNYTIRFTPKPAATLNIISVMLNGENTSDDVSVRNAEVQSVEVNFTSELKHVRPKALSLVNQGEVVDMSNVQYSIDGKKLTIDLSRIEHNDGFYCLTVNTALITDIDDHVGLTASPISWIEQTAKPVELNIAYNFPKAASVMVLAEEYQGEKTVFDTPQLPAAKYKYGTTLTLKVIPAYGYIFNRWSIDGNILSTEDTYDYYLSANKELKIFFDRESFNLAISNIVDDDDEATSTSGGIVKGGGSGFYEYGEEVELTAEPEPCHRFVGWFTDADADAARSTSKGIRHAAIDGLKLLSTDLTYTHIVEAGVKLYPIFHRLGDVNGDKVFSIADVVLITNYIKDGSAENFKKDEADANNDGKITIEDVEAIANELRIVSFKAVPQGNGEVTLTVPEVGITPGGISNVIIYFNLGTPTHTAFQLEVAYPEGIGSVSDHDGNPEFIKGDAYSETHNISSVYTEKGQDRFQCFSANSEPFSAQSGTLLILPIKANKAMAKGIYQATISPLEFVQTDATPDRPDAITFNIKVGDQTTYNLEEGWNWISANNLDEEWETMTFLKPLGDGVQRMLSQTEELINDSKYGLVGNLKTLSPTQSYKLQTESKKSHVLTGFACKPAETIVGLVEGWNWLGYVPTVALPMTIALENLEASDGDRIISLTKGFAVYDGNTWQNGFEMEPGEGYMYHRMADATTFCYSDKDAAEQSRKRISVSKSQNYAQIPWTCDIHHYPDVTTIIAQLYMEDRPLELGEYSVGAFCGQECRGVGKQVGDKLFITIHGTVADKESIVFCAYEHATERTLPISETIMFQGQCLGRLESPMPLHTQPMPTRIGELPDMSDIRAIYTPDGKRLSRLNRGVNIVVKNDGTTRKVVVE